MVDLRFRNCCVKLEILTFLGNISLTKGNTLHEISTIYPPHSIMWIVKFGH